MGRNSGGITSGGNDGSSGGAKGATEKGYTAKMVKNIVGLEQKYRRNRDETLHVFNPKGDIVTSFGGKGAQVKFDGKKIPANSILTHNHPRSLGATGIRAIGNSFSVQDIASAVAADAKEIRAVTPTYTFSLKRPKGGWGGTVKQVAQDFTKTHEKVRREMFEYLHRTDWNNDAVARAEVTHFHRVMSYMSKKYGWNYTKKRG